MKPTVILLLAVIIVCAMVPPICFAQEDGFATTAKAAAVMEQSSGRLLFEKNCHERLPMASTTKIVTALTVLNNCSDIEKVVEITADCCGIEGSSLYLRVGEHLSVRELLLGLMLRSGNDCAVALAKFVGGSVEEFADLMNKTAGELNLVDSHFVTPHGLHADDHYTSAYDLAKLTCAALDNPIFCEIVSTKRAVISNEGMEYDRVISNKNKLLFDYEGATGVKTGYTKKAGRCFVGSAKRNNMQVVAVVLNCGPMFEECAAMLDVAFSNFTLKNIIPKNKLCGAIYVKGEPTYYYAEQSFDYPLRATEKVKTEINLDGDVKEVAVRLGGEIIYKSSLLACK